jgi:hypothetical protein
MSPDQRRIAQLEARLADLQRKVDGFPRPVGNFAPTFIAGRIIYGTEFILPSGSGSGIYGLKYKTGLSTRTTVPDTIATANMATTYDGLAVARFYVGARNFAAWVICGPCTDSDGTTWAAETVSAPTSTPIIAIANPIRLAKVSGGTELVYRIYGL